MLLLAGLLVSVDRVVAQEEARHTTIRKSRLLRIDGILTASGAASAGARGLSLEFVSPFGVGVVLFIVGVVLREAKDLRLRVFSNRPPSSCGPSDESAGNRSDGEVVPVEGRDRGGESRRSLRTGVGRKNPSSAIPLIAFT